MTNTQPTPIAEVTQGEAISFLENACRNWIRVPRLSTDDVEDVRVALQRHRLTALADAERKLEEALQLLQPFAEAADDLDEKHGDDIDIWEASAAMSITAGNLRDASTFLAQGGGKAG